jgi:ABC-2 type transport system permease protein
MSLTRLLAVARKEVLQLRRDTRSLILAFLLPMMLLILFGYAISWDVRNIHIAVLDGDRSAASRELIDAFRSSGYFTIVRNLERPAQIDQLFDRGAAQAVLVIPAGFSSDLSAESSATAATAQIVVDGSDANTATIVLAYSEAIARTFSGKATLRGVKMDQPLSSITPESRVWYNEELASRNMIVPGLVAVIMMIIAAMLTSLTIAREWERGTMEQLAATPVSRVEVVLGKLLPYLAIGLADVVVCSILGVLLFDVPFRGSAALLMLLSFFFLTGALGLGIFISAATKSQVLATQVAMMATYLPAFLLSGFMFAIEVMPAPLRAVTFLVPARYFLVVTRGIFLKGVGLEVLWFQALLMIVFALAGLSLAVLRFRKELE